MCWSGALFLFHLKRFFHLLNCSDPRAECLNAFFPYYFFIQFECVECAREWVTHKSRNEYLQKCIYVSHVYCIYVRNKWTGGWTTIESYACVCANFQQIWMFTFCYVPRMNNNRIDGVTVIRMLSICLPIYRSTIGLNSKIEITDSNI